MSKILKASCLTNVVKVEGKSVQATVLSQGVKASDGIFVLDESEGTYVTSNASDINDILAQLSTLIQTVSDTFTAIGTGMTGPTTAPPVSLPTKITALATIKTALDAIKDHLK